MPIDITVRELVDEDYEALWDMMEEGDLEEGRDGPSFKREKFANEDNRYLVAVVGGWLVGYIHGCRIYHPDGGERNSLYVPDAFVVADMRNQGVFTELKRAFINYARAERFECVFSDVDNDNEYAIRANRRLGIPERPTETRIRFVKEL